MLQIMLVQYKKEHTGVLSFHENFGVNIAYKF